MGNPKLCSKNECTGCSACEKICPVGAITMKADDYGFYKPLVNSEKCINCKKCEKVCSQINGQQPKKNIRRAFAAINKSGFLLKESASGGLYPILAESFINREGKVFAAIYGNDFKVRIQEITRKNIKEGCGSKYVQSQTGDSYKQVKSYLENNLEVLYFGLPCQIAGLYNFLEKDYSNLYTVDLVCHGVPSEKLFLDYLAYMEKELGSRIIKVKHRYKKGKFGKIIAITLYIETIDGRIIIKDSADDPYLIAFRTGISIGSHCTSCKFSCIERTADITIGDFLCIGSINSYERDISKGVSMLLVNSKKGEKLLNIIDDKLILDEREIKECLVFNTNLWKKTKKHSLYEQFYEDLITKTFYEIRKKYMDKNLKNIFIKNIRKCSRNILGTEAVCKIMKNAAEKDGTIQKIDEILSKRDFSEDK